MLRSIRLGSSILAVALLAGCVGDQALTAGQRCPCAPGLSCDTATNSCVTAIADAGTDADAAAAGTCSCSSSIASSDLGQRYVTVSAGCFCASAFGFLCRSFDQAVALCSRSDVQAVSSATFEGCDERYLDVTIDSAAKGRPTYAVLRFQGNAFVGASVEADLLCHNLPADEANDMSLHVVTDGYFDSDPTCGSVSESSVCMAADAGGPSLPHQRPAAFRQR